MKDLTVLDRVLKREKEAHQQISSAILKELGTHKKL